MGKQEADTLRLLPQPCHKFGDVSDSAHLGHFLCKNNCTVCLHFNKKNLTKNGSVQIFFIFTGREAVMREKGSSSDVAALLYDAD